MRQITLGGCTGNRAIREAIRNGDYWCRRSVSNRWYVMRGAHTVFGVGHKPATLNDCRKWTEAKLNEESDT